MQIRYGPNMSKHSRSFVPQRVCRGCSFILDEPDHQPERCSIAIVTSRSYPEISFLPSFAVNPSGSGGSSYETPHFAPLLVVKALCLAGALSWYRPPVWLSRGGVSPEWVRRRGACARTMYPTRVSGPIERQSVGWGK